MFDVPMDAGVWASVGSLDFSNSGAREPLTINESTMTVMVARFVECMIRVDLESSALPGGRHTTENAWVNISICPAVQQSGGIFTNVPREIDSTYPIPYNDAQAFKNIRRCHRLHGKSAEILDFMEMFPQSEVYWSQFKRLVCGFLRIVDVV